MVRRFTRKEKMQVKRWYKTYVPVPEIARRLYRSVGTTRQLLLRLKVGRHQENLVLPEMGATPPCQWGYGA
jgi:hypothetical protein